MKNILVGLLLLLLLAGGAGVASWKLSPTVREMVYLAGLFSGVDAVEARSASALTDYPTAWTAVALIAYVNLQYRPPFDGATWRPVFDHPDEASDAAVSQLAGMLEGWGCLEKGSGADGLRGLDADRKLEVSRCAHEAVEADEAQRREEAEVAGRAVWTLCRLSGRDFGTRCDPDVRGILSATLSDREWRAALSNLNAWGLEQFGAEALASLGGSAAGGPQAALASFREVRP